VTIGTAQVKPGNYRLKADEDLGDLQVIRGRKITATIPCYWTDLPKKPANTEIKVNDNRVTEVQFKGRPVVDPILSILKFASEEAGGGLLRLTLSNSLLGLDCRCHRVSLREFITSTIATRAAAPIIPNISYLPSN
jgi:hypothetical protein